MRKSIAKPFIVLVLIIINYVHRIGTACPVVQYITCGNYDENINEGQIIRASRPESERGRFYQCSGKSRPIKFMDDKSIIICPFSKIINTQVYIYIEIVETTTYNRCFPEGCGQSSFFLHVRCRICSCLAIAGRNLWRNEPGTCLGDGFFINAYFFGFLADFCSLCINNRYILGRIRPHPYTRYRRPMAHNVVITHSFGSFYDKKSAIKSKIKRTICVCDDRYVSVARVVLLSRSCYRLVRTGVLNLNRFVLFLSLPACYIMFTV